MQSKDEVIDDDDENDVLLVFFLNNFVKKKFNKFLFYSLEHPRKWFFLIKY